MQCCAGASRQGKVVSGAVRCGSAPRLRSLREFDDKITAYYCGFEGVVDYYASGGF
jgi:predicted alpha/beta-fold hydrolase